MKDRFARFARSVSDAAGSPYAFVGACMVIVLWAVSGFLYGTSDTWQLIINTGTTIVTFLMIFLVQGSQNRDTIALHLKMNEIICALDKANDSLIDIEHGTDQEVREAQERQLTS